jgi:alanine racemase
MQFYRTWVEIDRGALTHNLKVIRDLVGPSVKIAIVVKADGYGHGLVPIAQAAVPYTDWLAVATVAEGVALREAGLRLPIMVLSPMLPFEADAVVTCNLAPLIECYEIAHTLSEIALRRDRKVKVHLKIDTGMGRFGVSPEAALDTAREISKLNGIYLEGLCSHFACADDDPLFTDWQLKLFNSGAESIENFFKRTMLKHIANSSATVCYKGSALDLIRVGALAYGILPCDYGTKPVLSWKARVSALRTLSEGAFISYGATYRTKRPSRIATIPVGYADGYLRALSNKGAVCINGGEAAIVGRVCMDQLMIDVTDLGEVQIGDVATLIGETVLVPRLTALADTTVHEVTSLIGLRVPRIYLGD